MKWPLVRRSLHLVIVRQQRAEIASLSDLNTKLLWHLNHCPPPCGGEQGTPETLGSAVLALADEWRERGRTWIPIDVLREVVQANADAPQQRGASNPAPAAAAPSTVRDIPDGI